MTINEMCRRVNAALGRLDEAEDHVLENKEYREDVLELERERLFHGTNADGSEIVPEYTPFTVMIKKKKGQPTDRVTLFDTGKFYGAFTMEREGDNVLFTSEDSKTKKLEEKYGERIFGLTDKDKEAARSASSALVLEWFRMATGI